MTPERWQRIDELFARAIELAPTEREPYVRVACGQDLDLCAEVIALLASDGDARTSLRAVVGAAAVPLQAAVGSGSPERLCNRFELRRELGAGGMGVVYEAFDEVRGECVALKTLPHAGAREIGELKREFRTLADLQHPNLVRLHELFSDGRRWFFTMSKVDAAPFVAAVRAPELDEPRLRSALRQLCAGVCAIHAAGKLHRDLKPSNVLVASDGHVTILDFGLAQKVERAADSSRELGVAGTPAYMAPEQLREAGAVPASDWYAVGGMLYEALTGAPPYGATSISAVIAAKQSGPPAGLRDRLATAPVDLAALALALLSHDPDARPTGADVLAVIGEAAATAVPPKREPEALFVGRDRELGVLGRAFATVEGRAPAVVYISGQSGIGKSALCDRFLASVRESALVLRGRCYERENVPFKALDEVVDALARYLARLDSVTTAKLTPRYAGELCRVFPALAKLPAFAEEPIAHADPTELRRRAFAALKDLLARVAVRRPVVIAIDDLQWGDADSADLLADLVRPPDPPSILWIGCYRSNEQARSPVLARLAQSVSGQTLVLEPLGAAESLTLAAALVGDARANEVATEAQGSPFFIRELALGSGELTSATVADVVSLRVKHLPAVARHLLELVAVAGSPLAIAVVLDAAQLARSDDVAVSLLRAATLVRTVDARIVTYHDRIRETIASALPASLLQHHHLALARALERSGTDEATPDVLALHYRAAGDHERALLFATEAAVAAAKALAFDHAIAQYRIALELAPESAREQRYALWLGLAEALAAHGRGFESAGAYLKAVDLVGTADVLDLERRAAEELLSSGHIDEGMAVAARLLATVGMKLPQTRGQVLGAFVIERMRLRLRGLKFKERSARELSAETLRRIDVGWAVVRGMGYVDPPRLASVQTRNLADALNAGEPTRIARSLAMEAGFVAIVGEAARPRSEQLLSVAEPLAARLGDPFLDGHLALTRANVDFFSGNWRRATDGYDQTAALFRERCQNVAWEIANCGCYAMLCLYFMGEMPELARRNAELLRDAQARGDLYLSTTLRTMISPMSWLAADRPQLARQEASEAIQSWTRRGFFLEHFLEVIALGYVDLYEGRPRAAWERIVANWRPLQRSLLFQVQVVEVRSTYLRGRAAVAAMADREQPRSETKRFAHEVRTAARTLARLRAPWAAALAGLLGAGLANASGDHDGALAQLDRSIAALEACDMALYAGCARRNRGVILGGDEGAQIIATQDRWMNARGVANPEAMARALAPG